MIKSLAFVLVILGLALAQGNTTNPGMTPSVRFVNGLEGHTLTLTIISSASNQTITLPFAEVSDFVQVADGIVHVASVMTENGTALTNVSILVSFRGPATVACVMKSGAFYLVLFNETLPNGSLVGNANKTFVRVIDLAVTPQWISLASGSSTLVQYVGFLEQTVYASAEPVSNGSLVFFESSATAATPLITLDASLEASNAYTVFFFNPASGPMAVVDFDQVLTTQDFAPVTTSPMRTSGAQMTSGAHMTSGVHALTTGVAHTSTSGSSSSGLPSSANPSTSSSSSGNTRGSDNSAQKVGFSVVSVMIMTFIAMF